MKTLIQPGTETRRFTARFAGRTRRYPLTVMDYASRFAFAVAVPRHTSHCTTRFSALANTVMNAVNERFNRTIQEEFVDYEDKPVR